MTPPLIFTADDGHEYRWRDKARPIHTGACPCWSGLVPTSFTRLKAPGSSLWDYLSSPRRSRRAVVFP